MDVRNRRFPHETLRSALFCFPAAGYHLALQGRECARGETDRGTEDNEKQQLLSLRLSVGCLDKDSRRILVRV
jgi:hypothetical protein